MIIGVGIDVVDEARFARQLERTPALRERLFSPPERDLGLSSLAARFAAKEALAKSLGAPIGMSWQDVTVIRPHGTPPRFDIRGTVADRAAELGVSVLHLSISHDAGIATAIVIAERCEAPATDGTTADPVGQ